jgi:hypothetical protein
LEFGNIDYEGHGKGWMLAKNIDGLLAEIAGIITSLMAAGRESIRVVTDHGWLLLPKGLPKIDLPIVLVENKWGRCATLKIGASSDERLYPWYWNPNQYFALADGISCYKKGEEFAHGGLSLQECMNLQVTISQKVCEELSGSVEITDIVWKGFRCTAAVDGITTALFLDIRTQAGNPSSSVVVGIKPFNDNGTASVIVESEELGGHDAVLVLLDETGSLAAQISTIIGGKKSD